jgi:hypothetical protein
VTLPPSKTEDYRPDTNKRNTERDTNNNKKTRIVSNDKDNNKTKQQQQNNQGHEMKIRIQSYTGRVNRLPMIEKWTQFSEKPSDVGMGEKLALKRENRQ